MVRAAFKFCFVLCMCALKSVFFLCLEWLLLLPFKSEVKKCAEMLTAWKHSVLFNRAGTRAVFWEDVFLWRSACVWGGAGPSLSLGERVPVGHSGGRCSRLTNNRHVAPQPEHYPYWISLPSWCWFECFGMSGEWNNPSLFFLSQLQGLGCTESHWTWRRLL